MPKAGPSNPVTDLIKNIVQQCKTSYGWTDDRRHYFIKELTQASQYSSNKTAAFMAGLKALASKPLGYGLRQLPSDVIWRYKPNLQGPSIVKQIKDEQFEYYRIRNIQTGDPDKITGGDCAYKAYGMDCEFAIGEDGRNGARNFFAHWAPQSSSDGSSTRLWEHRTKPSNTIEEQIKDLSNLHEHLNDYLTSVPRNDRFVNRAAYACGSHLHIHTHNETYKPHKLFAYLDMLATLWNGHPYNKAATMSRIQEGYGEVFKHDDDTVRDPVFSDGEGCDVDDSISAEYRAFTSPDFSKKLHVQKFGALLYCVDWVLRNTNKLPPPVIHYRTRDAATLAQSRALTIRHAKAIFKTDALKELI